MAQTEALSTQSQFCGYKAFCLFSTSPWETKRKNKAQDIVNELTTPSLLAAQWIQPIITKVSMRTKPYYAFFSINIILLTLI